MDVSGGLHGEYRGPRHPFPWLSGGHDGAPWGRVAFPSWPLLDFRGAVASLTGDVGAAIGVMDGYVEKVRDLGGRVVCVCRVVLLVFGGFDYGYEQYGERRFGTRRACTREVSEPW